MQETVTARYHYNLVSSRQNGFKMLMMFFAVLLCALLIFALFSHFLFQNKKANLFEEKTVFYVVLEKTKNKSHVESLQKTVQNARGAGYMIEDDGFFKIVGYAYFSKQVAESVLKRVKEKFVQAEIVAKTLPKIKRKIKNIIKSEHDFLLALEFVENVTQELYEDIAKYSKSKISKVQLFEFLQKTKLELSEKQKRISEIENKIKSEIQIKEQFQIALSSVESVFQDCISVVSRMGAIDQTMKNAVVLLLEMQGLLRENLNKIK